MQFTSQRYNVIVYALYAVEVQTEVANSEIAAPDHVWVPAAGN